jgi:signal transduction histidine kinase
MSHELRTPLNAIIGFTRIVKRKAKGKLDEKQVDNLGKVQASAEHLLGLINTILDIAKIEAGGMDVHATEFAIAPLIDLCVSTAQPLAKPGVKMTANIAPDLPLVYSDADKIKQILLNLLSNAAKFTHEGTINVTCNLQKAQRQQPVTAPSLQQESLNIAVTDTGIGMNEEQLRTVFQAFIQGDSSTTRQYGGTGLGLAISRHYAELMSGKIEVSSVEGKGSIFTVTLPTHVTDSKHHLNAPTVEHPAVEA